MADIHAKINKNIELVAYEGLESNTASVVVEGKKIGIDVKAAPGTLRIVHGDSVTAYNGSSDQTFVIDEELARGADLTAETRARKEADQSIMDDCIAKIDSETSERKAMDGQHDAAIKKNADTLAALVEEIDVVLEEESATRKEADDKLASDIAAAAKSTEAEVAARYDADATLNGKISDILSGDVALSGDKSFDASTITINKDGAKITLGADASTGKLTVSSPAMTTDSISSDGILSVGSAMSMGGNALTDLKSPEDGASAANKDYVDSQVGTCLSKNGGGTVDGKITAGGFIVNGGKYYQFLKADGSYDDINIENGSGEASNQARQDGTTGTFSFTGKNPNATALDPSLTGDIAYGAVGAYSTAFGGKSSAQGKRSFACGTTTIAKGDYSFASGDNSVALGADSHAEGGTTVSKGDKSHSEGSNTQALGDNSHAEGEFTAANAYASHSEGHNTSTLSELKVPTGGGGTPSGGGDTPSKTPDDTLGGYSHTQGDNTQTLGYASHSEGVGTRAWGHYSHSEGLNTVAGELIENGTLYKVSGDAAHAEGHKTTASGKYSHAEGDSTTASGLGSHAEGKSSAASGDYSKALGNNTEASGNQSLSLGAQTKARGASSISAGVNTVAEGAASLVGGTNSTVNGSNAFAWGLGLESNADGQSVLGRYNVPNAEALFQVGNGSSASHVNAFEVLSDGRAKVRTAPTESNDVATKAYVDTKVSEAGGSKLYRHDIKLDGYEGDNYQVFFTLIDTNASKYTQNTLADAINSAAILSATGWYGIAAPRPVVAFTSSANNFSLLKLNSDGRAWTYVLWTTDMLTVSDTVTAL